MFILKQLWTNFAWILFTNLQTSENSGPELIIALDNLSEKKAKEIISLISKECSEYIDRIVFKVNDLLVDKWLSGVSNIVKRAESKNIFQRFVVEADIILEHFWVTGLREYFYWKWFWVFVDWKWNDIPNTIENYLNKLKNSSLWNKADYVTLHSSAWYEAIKKAVEKRNELWLNVKILAVTALTSLTDADTNIIFDENRKKSVLKLAKEALRAWADWIVCSPKEAQILRDVFGRIYPNFLIITPWLRFKWGVNNDQKNVEDPATAIANWANHGVMGRPIIESENIPEAVKRYFTETDWVKFMPDENRHKSERISYTWNWEDRLKNIGALYIKPELWKFCRLASKLVSVGYVNIWECERSYEFVEDSANDLARQVKARWIEADLVMWAQMWSVILSHVLAEKLAIWESLYTEKEEYSPVDFIDVWENDLWGKKAWRYYRKLEWNEATMKLKRHDIDLNWKKVILSEDNITKWTTLEQMIKIVQDGWWQVVGITCVSNRYWSDNYKLIPLLSCYNPPEFELYWDDKTPEEARGNYPKLPEGSLISEKPKFDWPELRGSMGS